jgi:hypothetical protein
MTAKNFDVPMLNLKGKAQRVDEDGTERDYLLADVAVAVLMAQFEEDKASTGKEQIQRTSLAIRIGEGGERQYTSAELALIVKRTEKAGNALWTYRMTEFIDGIVTDAEPAKSPQQKPVAEPPAEIPLSGEADCARDRATPAKE